MGDNGAKELVEPLKSNKSIYSLTLCNFLIGSVPQLDGNLIENEGTIAISQLLLKNHTICELNLRIFCNL